MVKFFRIFLVIISLNTFVFANSYLNISDIECTFEQGSDQNSFFILICDYNVGTSEWEFFADKLTNRGYGYLAYTPKELYTEILARDRTRRLWRENTQYNTGILLNELETILIHLDVNFRIPKNKIVLVGAGLGANIALQYAVANRNIQRVVLISPGKEYYAVSTRNSIQSYGDRPIMFLSSFKDGYSYQTCLDYVSYLSGSNNFYVKFYNFDKRSMKLANEEMVVSDILSWIDK